MGHYSEQYESDAENWKNLTDDQLGFTYKKDVKKHSDGKLEDARLCYLSALGKLSGDKNILDIGYRLDYLNSSLNINELRTLLLSIADIYDGFETLFREISQIRKQAIESGKYSVLSYRDSISKDLLLDAAARHFIKYILVDHFDEESGYNHLAHIASNILMLLIQVNDNE